MVQRTGHTLARYTHYTGIQNLRANAKQHQLKPGLTDFEDAALEDAGVLGSGAVVTPHVASTVWEPGNMLHQ